MINKTHNKLMLLMLFISISCNDKLELTPENSIPSDAFYSNADNLRAGLFGIYDALQERGVVTLPILEGMSDNVITSTVFAPDIAAYAAGQSFVAGDNRSVEYMYGSNYRLIQRANLLLDNIDGVPAITNDERELIRAETKTLRSYAYMNLTYLFGDVPLITSFSEINEILNVSRNPKSGVITFILKELEEAANELSTSPAVDGRLTKQAALGLRARVMIYEARLGNVTWAQALSAVNSAITAANDGGNGLINTGNPSADYQSIFTESNEGNEEFIFSVKNDAIDLGSDNMMDRYSWQAGLLLSYIHQNLADAYPYADGTAYEPIDNTFVGRDPRLSANIMHEGLTFRGVTYDGTDAGGFVSANSVGTATNLFNYKFITTDYSSTWNEGSLDIPILRYADLLLMQAEALNETGGDAYPPLNAVRNRSGLPSLSGFTQSDLRDAIILERRLELALEGLRWFDLITLGIAEQTINNIQEERADIIRDFVVGRNELLPIPQSELDLNPNLAPQNQGYSQ